MIGRLRSLHSNIALGTPLIDRSLEHESTQIPALLKLRSYREASGENGAAKGLRAVLEDLAGYYKASWIDSRIRKMEVF